MANICHTFNILCNRSVEQQEKQQQQQQTKDEMEKINIQIFNYNMLQKKYW